MTYLTPVFYPKEILSGMIAKLASLNPLTSYADIFRYVFTDSGVATIGDWIYIATTSISILILGIRIFARSWPRVVVML
jgi:ABC-type polysaccharide/polyol phosphate export permease